MRKLATISRSRLVRHLVQDFLLIGWVVGWVRVGFWMHDLVAVLRQPADRLGSVGGEGTLGGGLVGRGNGRCGSAAGRRPARRALRGHARPHP